MKTTYLYLIFFISLFSRLSYTQDNIPIWVTKFSGDAGGSDMGTAMIVKGEYLYVTGHALMNNLFQSGTSLEIITTKYDKTGAVIWTSRYNNDNYPDSATAIAVDPAGNIFVTGVKHNGTNYDCITLKYNSSGALQWAQTYDNGGDDVSRSIVLDNNERNSNIYICGWSYSSNDKDYITIKYNSSGVQQWASRYDYGRNSIDHAYDLALDNELNVVVTGYCTGNYFEYSDAVTIKYKNSDGTIIWTQSYTDDSTYDYGIRIVIDELSNIYVGGASGKPYVEDMLILKYDSTGSLIWNALYDGSSGLGQDIVFDMAIDDSHNVYITGESMSGSTQTTYDYATLKFSNNGTQMWVNRFNGTQNTIDKPVSLVLDADNNVYVTGWAHNGSVNKNDYVTIKYNTYGNEIWKNIYNECNSEDSSIVVAVDNNGNVFVTGGSAGDGTQDITTIMLNKNVLDNNADMLWVKRYNNNYEDFATDIETDATGNVYVTGMSRSIYEGRDFLTIKYNTSGTVLWTARYDYQDGSDSAASVNVDETGNVYVTGSCFSSSNGYDCVTLKYNSSGVLQWSSVYNGPSNLDDRGLVVIPVSTGNVYICGRTINSKSGTDYLLIKYNSSGVQQWAVTYNGPANNFDMAYDMALDNNENIYVTGGSYDTGTVYKSATTIKYNSSGSVLWEKRYDGNDVYDETRSIILDDSNNVYVSGITGLTDTTWDYLTIKYNSSGYQQWVNTYDGIANAKDMATGITVDNNYNVYVTGFSRGVYRIPYNQVSNEDYVTIKYNSAGNQVWLKRFNGPINNHDVPNDIKFDGSDYIYVTGYSLNSNAEQYNYATVKYDLSGNEIWVQQYNFCNSQDSANAIAIDNDGNVYVTGVSDKDYATVKYPGNSSFSKPLTSHKGNIIPGKFRLYQNYPNPFNPITSIKYEIPVGGSVSVIIYDITGRVVNTLINSEYRERGIQNVSFDGTNYASGIYFYRLILNVNGSQYEKNNKMVLIK